MNKTLARLENPAQLETLRLRAQAERDPSRPIVSVCSGPGCIAFQSRLIGDAFERELAARGLSDKVRLSRTGCHGFCERGPSVVILPREIAYLKVKAEDVAEIVETTLVGGGVVERLLYRGEDGKPVEREGNIPFYANQTRHLSGDLKRIDPLSFEDYLARGGYGALVKAITAMTPAEVVAEVKKSGLRGRGGAGFPTGDKWAAASKVPADARYVIVNADEGDPGAYMDRGLLEGNPHAVIEGLMIAGYAVGASEGFLYIRQEYPLAVDHVLYALETLRSLGLLGRNILGTGFSFDATVHRGAGAFVSGESSALMSAIEGRVGEPRPKYVRTSVSGLRGKPSVLNNVETLASVPSIIANGADCFAGTGTEGSKGTKIFSLVGKVKNTGLVEVPMGTPLRKIIFDIGGGVPDGKAFKAVQTGGPSGGVLPESMLDLHVDFDELARSGSMMGSGGMIVMDEDTCMVDVAKYFLHFLADESCGKCVPCREGIFQLLTILRRISTGGGLPGDIELIEDIAATTKDCSLCGLGQSAPNPVLSALRYFRDEYVAHVDEHRCPAGVCKELLAYWIDPDTCIGCGRCREECPVGAVSGEKKAAHVIDGTKCTRCDGCYRVCPPKVRAVKKLSRAEAEQRRRAAAAQEVAS